MGLVLSLPKSALFLCLLSSGEVFGSGSDDLNTGHSKAYKILVFPKEQQLNLDRRRAVGETNTNITWSRGSRLASCPLSQIYARPQLCAKKALINKL